MPQPHLLQPVAPNYDTGGYLYNRRMAEHGAVQLATLELGEAASSPLPSGAAVVLDSLFMRHPPEALPVLQHEQPILLVHHLACLEPSSPRSVPDTAPELQWLRCARGVIVTSEFMREQVEALVPELPIEVVDPGVDPEFLVAAPERTWDGPLVLLTVGHIIERKGYVQATQALRLVRDRHRLGDWTWHVIGDDAMEPGYALAWRREVSRAGLDDQLVFHGPKRPAEVAEAMSQAHLFLLPSLFEAYGMVYAEAIAMGLPVVAYDSGEVGRMVARANAGVVCPVGDVDTLASHIAEYLGDRSRLRTHAARARSAARSWSDVAAEFTMAVDRLATRMAGTA